MLSQLDANAGHDAVILGVRIYYLLSGAILIVGNLLTWFGVKERDTRQLPPRAVVGSRRRQLALDWLEPWKHRNFVAVFATRAAVILGLTLFMTYIEYYFANVIQVSNSALATATVALLTLLGAMLSALTLGFLSDHVGRVPIVFFATGCMAVAAFTFVVLRGNFPLWPLGLVFGLGYGAYTSVDWALAIDVLPSQESAGKDLGLWSLASTLPAILAPLLGSLTISTIIALGGQLAFSYRAIFALAAVFMVLGAIFIVGVQDAVARERQTAQPPLSTAN